MGIQALCSTADTAEAAVQNIKEQSKITNPKGVIFFASSAFNPGVVSDAMQNAFTGSSCIGCTTAGEIVSGKMLSNSLVALLLGDDVLEDICVESVANIKNENNIPAAFDRFSDHFSTSVAAMDVGQCVGIILIDGMSGAEERLMDTIGNLTDIIFIGGSAGDDLQFKQTFVFANGKASSNAAALCIMKLKRGFDVIKTQSFRSTNKKLTATEVNEAERRVVSFNHKPAVMAYAEVLGCSPEEAANRFMSNPVGLMDGAEPYIRSPQRFDQDDMIFYCNIKKGMTLELMEATNIVEDTKKAVGEKIRELGSVNGIIDFHCILRTLELRQKNQCDAYGAIFTNIPTIGFSTYGEEYIGHVNQTSTMLVFK